jgi:glutathione synthase/RimK-type ligase-like ATP-grasp enzyme
MTILVFAPEEDLHFIAVERHLKAADASYFRCSANDFLEAKAFISNLPDAILLRAASQEVCSKQLITIWNRSFFSREHEKRLQLSPIDLYRGGEFEFFVFSLGSVVPHARWVNSIEAEWFASFKNHQLQQAQIVGLKTPDYYIGNDPKLAASFIKNYAFLTVKPYNRAGLQDEGKIHYVHSRKKVQHELLEFVDAVSNCPIILQNYVEKQLELRVTIIGDTVLACSIDSQASHLNTDDFRMNDMKDLKHEIYQLPISIERALLALMKRLNLVFGCVDIILTPENEYVFLEVNPSGQWLWIEEATGLPIAETIANFLMTESAPQH